jgi:hypothetical protein
MNEPDDVQRSKRTYRLTVAVLFCLALFFLIYTWYMQQHGQDPSLFSGVSAARAQPSVLSAPPSIDRKFNLLSND